MLSNAYFLAKFRFDTAENAPAKKKSKIMQKLKFPNFANFAINLAAQVGLVAAELGGDVTVTDLPEVVPFMEARWARRVVPNFWQIKFRSFSAVSAPIFARKYAFFSIF